MPCMPRKYDTFPILPHVLRLVLIRGGLLLVYENNGRILKCGHELCAGEFDRLGWSPGLALFILACEQIAWKI